MKAVVAAFNQEKALVRAFSVITNLRMELFQALLFLPQHKLFPALLQTADWAREREPAASRSYSSECRCAGDVNDQSEMDKKVRMS